MSTINIVTDRLLLRPYKREDERAVYEVISQKEIYDMTLMIPHPYPKESVVYWIEFTRKNIEKGTAYELGIFDKVTGDYLGNGGLANISYSNHSAELAYFISPNYWNKGYATEAVKGLIEFGINFLNLNRIIGRCMIHNAASKQVLEKCHLQYEGLARQEIKKENQYIDILRYAILRSDFKSIRL